jgi:hypothetical protein
VPWIVSLIERRFAMRTMEMVPSVRCRGALATRRLSGRHGADFEAALRTLHRNGVICSACYRAAEATLAVSAFRRSA